MKKFTFISLFVISGMLLSSEKAEAQTASTRPISEILTANIKQELAKKQGGVPADPTSNYNKLPSGTALPKQATDAAQKYNATGHANSGRRDLLPGNSPLKAEEVRQRNLQKLAAIKSNSGR